MKEYLQKVALRQQAVYVPATALASVPGSTGTTTRPLRGTCAGLVANLAKLGYGVSEPLLTALNQTLPTFQVDLLAHFREVMGVDKNWAPLVKGWDTPTGETLDDHIITFFANVFGTKGARLACGHVIPAGTFPLERYNGCPFCGTPFELGKIEQYGQGSKLKVLDLWTERELLAYFTDLLTAKTALDATQMDSLKILLATLPLPEVEIGMKETLMAVIDACIANGQPQLAQRFFVSPTDILRYLWYKHTGFLQLVMPKTIVKRAAQKNKHLKESLDRSGQAKITAKAALKLKYSRQEGQMVARWLNGLPMGVEKICETMHPKRGIWVRMIRALRLPEYSQKPGLEKLKAVLDMFYHENYPVWQGRVDYYRLKLDEASTFELLKQRPGLFARSLFANMLWFGPEPTVAAFAEVVDQVPARLVLTLAMYAENYFGGQTRAVKPLGGPNKAIQANSLLGIYTPDQLRAMTSMVADLGVLAIKKRFAKLASPGRTMFIEPGLFKMPLAIGDRSDNVQDLPSALMGSRFPVEGAVVRLFMQWGMGLPAQHLDMDLSCHLAYPRDSEICSFSRLVATGCKHSGDIRAIPDKVGTAEYIEVNLNELAQAGVQYVTFTCNAYSVGTLTPNLVVGWMDSRFPMKISERTGVAYDPSCVQQQVRITGNVAKGLVFGVLDVAVREVVWLEMAFAGQMVQSLNTAGVQALLAKLDSKMSIGNLLKIKAEAQGAALVDTTEGADEVYTCTWGMNAAGVIRLLVD
jgi:hypothetical protein